MTAWSGLSKVKTGPRLMLLLSVSMWIPPEALKALHPLEQLATRVPSYVARVLDSYFVDEIRL
ncbi:uncharacterized protein FFFS_15998 [Fusarium fujikuroi]|nr:uncharacterized protein FFFS_15998 [Fusarium fujikuroi]